MGEGSSKYCSAHCTDGVATGCISCLPLQAVPTLLAAGRPPLALRCTAHTWHACQGALAALGQQDRQK